MNNHNLYEENYFDMANEKKYCGSSQIKSFMDCEARTMAKINGEWEEGSTTALLVGSYVDAAVSGTLDLFKAKHPEILKKDGSLKSEYVKADYILNRIERDELFMKYISGNHQTIMTGKIANVPIKIKIDSYFPDKVIVDMKCVRDFEPIWNNETKTKENFIDYWKYTLQGALYQEIVRQNTGKKLPFYIAAVTKENEPDIAILGIPDEELEKQLDIIKEILPRISNIKNGLISPDRCEKCDYCHYTKKLSKVIDYRDI